MKNYVPVPTFVHSNVRLTIADREYAFLNQPLSIYGIAGIRWPHFDPTSHAGEFLKLNAQVLCKQPYTLDLGGHITVEEAFSEQTKKTTYYLGVHIEMRAEDRERLSKTIAAEGFVPESYTRKFPRIPASSDIPDMPLRALARAPTGVAISFEIMNLSPSGILLCSDNPNAAAFAPGAGIHVEVEPRRLSLDPFKFDGLICRRTTDRLSGKAGTLRRLFGIRFTNISKEHKQVFLDTLRTVLLRLQGTAQNK
ncbi:MAG: PilZ domain-containing protein [Deltaproteobacteria bacterium]|nr:PilZ domain-containing protein [Deltaproteobacteria bacterium]